MGLLLLEMPALSSAANKRPVIRLLTNQKSSCSDSLYTSQVWNVLQPSVTCMGRAGTDKIYHKCWQSHIFYWTNKNIFLLFRIERSLSSGARMTWKWIRFYLFSSSHHTWVWHVEARYWSRAPGGPRNVSHDELVTRAPESRLVGPVSGTRGPARDICHLSGEES